MEPTLQYLLCVGCVTRTPACCTKPFLQSIFHASSHLQYPSLHSEVVVLGVCCACVFISYLELSLAPQAEAQTSAFDELTQCLTELLHTLDVTRDEEVRFIAVLCMYVCMYVCVNACMHACICASDAAGRLSKRDQLGSGSRPDLIAFSLLVCTCLFI